MSITDQELGKQLYTLYATDRQTGQKVILSYNGSAIITSDHSGLIKYATQEMNNNGNKYIYTISMVRNIILFDKGAQEEIEPV